MTTGAAHRGVRCVIDCYYRRLGADGEFLVFDSTDGTRSNWDPEIQHGSPPLALMTKLIEELARGSGLRVGRLTLDILGAIPVAPVKVRAWVERPGKRISLMMAEMSAARTDGADRAVARVTAWLLATSDTADAATDRYPPLVEGEAIPVPHGWVGAKGYLETVTWRRQPETGETGNVVWLSPLVPLVDSEPTTDSAAARDGGRLRQRSGCGAGSRAVHVHEHRHRGAPAPAARRRGLRASGPRLDRTRRDRRHHRRVVRPARVHRHLRTDAAGAAQP